MTQHCKQGLVRISGCGLFFNLLVVLQKLCLLMFVFSATEDKRCLSSVSWGLSIRKSEKQCAKIMNSPPQVRPRKHNKTDHRKHTKMAQNRPFVFFLYFSYFRGPTRGGGFRAFSYRLEGLLSSMPAPRNHNSRVSTRTCNRDRMPECQRLATWGPTQAV